MFSNQMLMDSDTDDGCDTNFVSSLHLMLAIFRCTVHTAHAYAATFITIAGYLIQLSIHSLDRLDGINLMEACACVFLYVYEEYAQAYAYAYGYASYNRAKDDIASLARA